VPSDVGQSNGSLRILEGGLKGRFHGEVSCRGLSFYGAGVVTATEPFVAAIEASSDTTAKVPSANRRVRIFCEIAGALGLVEPFAYVAQDLWKDSVLPRLRPDSVVGGQVLLCADDTVTETGARTESETELNPSFNATPRARRHSSWLARVVS